MRKGIMLFVFGLLPLMMAGQSVTQLRTLEQLPNSQADVQYNNLFGNFRNDALDEPFPYVVIEMNLSGGESAVRMAKDRISLDVGTMLEVKSTVKTLPNKIVFLIQKGVRNIYILCGDGCDKILLYSGTLIGNKVYTCTVEYQPATQQGGGNQDAVLAQMAEMQKQMEAMKKLLENQQSGGGGGAATVVGDDKQRAVEQTLPNHSSGGTEVRQSKQTVDAKVVSETEEYVEYEIGGVRFKMIKVSGGTFQMGLKKSDERPVHSVTLSDYYIGQTEVTQALWEAVMGSNPSNWKGDNLPVESVSWEECQEFVGRLSRITGRRFALPTEAQWEYAARGGSRSRGYKYSGSDKIKDVAWYYKNSSGQTHPVGQKQANELGLYDMSGNVYEWCQDWFGSYPSSPQSDPKGSSTGSYRVNRGGCWDCYACICCWDFCRGTTPGTRSDDIGLRLALLF